MPRQATVQRLYSHALVVIKLLRNVRRLLIQVIRLLSPSAQNQPTKNMATIASQDWPAKQHPGNTRALLARNKNLDATLTSLPVRHVRRNDFTCQYTEDTL